MVVAVEGRDRLWVPGSVKGDSIPKPPGVEAILSLITESKEYFSNFHKQCKEEEDYYLLERRVPAPPGIDPVRPATAAAIVNVAADHVDVENITIDVPSSPRSRARAERLKRFYQGCWLSVKKPVLRTAVRQSFLYGIGCLKTMFDADRWSTPPILDDYDSEDAYRAALEEFQLRRHINFPFVVEPANPHYMLWDDSRQEMQWACEVIEAPVGELRRRYPEWSTAKKHTAMARWAEYWDSEWVAYLADNDIIYGPVRHGYGFLPYVQILPTLSYTFRDGPPERRYRGILRPVHNLLDEEARLVTQIGAIVRTTAWRTLDFSGPPNAVDAARQEYELFGGKNRIPPGVTVSLSPMTQVPPDLYQQLSVVQGMIEEATFPNVVRGLRPRGVSTGFAISVLAGMGRLVFRGVAEGLRHAVEQVNSRFAMLVENKAKGRVTVYAQSADHQLEQSITPEDVRGFYENRVDIKAEAPEEREREALLALKLRTPGPDGMPIISLYEAQRRAGVLNPLEEQMQTKLERLVNGPEITAIQGQELLARLGYAQQQLEAAGIAPGGGGIGSRNVGGSQLQRPGEAAIQGQRMNTTLESRAFPQGMGGLDILGRLLSGSPGGAARIPSGQVVR